VASRIHQQILTESEQELKQKPPVHELRDGRRLLSVSSELLKRVTWLAYIFRPH
jgi:hypothetical protein